MTHTIEVAGEEQTAYLALLQGTLESLAKNLHGDRTRKLSPLVKGFGDKNSWDWSRLPREGSSYQALSELVIRVCQEYQLFDWCEAADPAQSMGWFDRITLNGENGMPWAFDFIELQRLKQQSPTVLAKMPSYQQGAKDYLELMLTDYTPPEEVAGKAQELHQGAMRRNFLEHLQSRELIGWDGAGSSTGPVATKIIDLGGESLWNISYATFSLASGMFHLYCMDLWQDLLDPKIIETDGRATVDQGIRKCLNTGERNAAWYMLRSVDEAFESIHPVHVTRAVVGPLECKYMTHPHEIPPLAITKELLTQDPEAALLRMSMQYTYAPNHTTLGDHLRQVYYREDWRDEIIVAPAKYCSQVARSVLGTSVRVFEA